MTPTIALAGRMGSGKDTAAYYLQTNYGYTVVGFADALKRLVSRIFSVDIEALWGPSERRNAPLAAPLTVKDVRQAAKELSGRFIHPKNAELLVGFAAPDEAAKKLVEALAPLCPIATPRRLLQYVGTDWGRAIHPDLWLTAVARTAKAVHQGVPYFRRDGALSELLTRNPPSGVVISDCRFANEAQFVTTQMSGYVFWVDSEKRVRNPATFQHASEPTLEALQPHVTAVIGNNGPQSQLPIALSHALANVAKART